MAITSPLDVAWDHAYWVEGSEFKALYPSAGTGRFSGVSSRAQPATARVGTWPDEVGTLDAVQATANNKPTFYSAGISAWNNQPYMDFPDSDAAGAPDNAVGLRTAAFTSSAQPNEIVVIARVTSLPSSTGQFLWDPNGALDGDHLIGTADATHWRIYAGFPLDPGNLTADTSAHVFDTVFNHGSSSLTVDGTASTGGAIPGYAGDRGFKQMSIGSDGGGSTIFPQIVFVGIKLGAQLSAGDRADLLAFAQAHYGTP